MNRYRFSAAHHYVSQSICSSYITGGRYWPQKRWAIVNFLLTDLSSLSCEDPFGQKEMHEFFISELSLEQLLNIRKTMEADHINGGINTNHIEDIKLISEFKKSQIGVSRIITAMQNNSVPDYFQENDNALIDKEHKKLKDFEVKLTLSDRLKLKELNLLLKDVIRKHKLLSRLFRISYFSSAILEKELISLNTKISKQDNQIEIVEGYDLNFAVDDFINRPMYVRTLLTKKIFDDFSDEVKEKYNEVYPYLIYDDSWASYMREFSMNQRGIFSI